MHIFISALKKIFFYPLIFHDSSTQDLCGQPIAENSWIWNKISTMTKFITCRKKSFRGGGGGEISSSSEFIIIQHDRINFRKTNRRETIGDVLGHWYCLRLIFWKSLIYDHVRQTILLTQSDCFDFFCHSNVIRLLTFYCPWLCQLSIPMQFVGKFAWAAPPPLITKSWICPSWSFLLLKPRHIPLQSSFLPRKAYNIFIRQRGSISSTISSVIYTCYQHGDDEINVLQQEIHHQFCFPRIISGDVSM